jgi:H+-transporting ATPase
MPCRPFETDTRCHILGVPAFAHARTKAHSAGSFLRVAQLIPFVITAILSAVPIALPATFTLAAALGARALALKGVLLTRLSALHEAAAVNVLCADKTGTLTQNDLTVGAAIRSAVDRASVCHRLIGRSCAAEGSAVANS